MKRQKRLAILVLIVVVTVAFCAAALAALDISNGAESSGVEKWLASSVFQIKLHAYKPRRPSGYTTTEDDLVRASSMYQQMCSFCHGASRGRMAPFAKSFSPRPPQFVIESSSRPTWMDAYVIQHGIRWTGMPSFQSLSEADVWHLALYVEGRNQPRE